MNMARTALLVAVAGLLCGGAYGQFTLFEATGARSRGMGNCGYALSDDETALFYNPAGLGFKNDRWNGGALSCFAAPLVPDAAKSFYAVVYQNENAPAGFSSYVNHLNFGRQTEAGPGNGPQTTSYAYEYTAAAGGGYAFSANKAVANGFGLAAKLYRSEIGVVETEEKHRRGSVAFDAGYLLRIAQRIRLGIVLKNIGPDISGTMGAVKLPLTLGAGLGYKDAFDRGPVHFLDFSDEVSFRCVNNYFGNQLDNNVQAGIDLRFFRTFSARAGYSNDLTRAARTISWGFGASVFNHVDFDFFQTGNENGHSPYFYNYGWSLSCKRILNWEKQDRKWWLCNSHNGN
jgi:hypothetical protein